MTREHVHVQYMYMYVVTMGNIILICSCELLQRHLLFFSVMMACISTCISLMYMYMYGLQDGSTPLDIAVEKGHKEIIELLKLNMSKVRLGVHVHVHRHIMCVLV